MNAVLVEQPPIRLEERLKNGAELLFEMESRGQRSVNYQRWLKAWLELLDRYESLHHHAIQSA